MPRNELFPRPMWGGRSTACAQLPAHKKWARTSPYEDSVPVHQSSLPASRGLPRTKPPSRTMGSIGWNEIAPKQGAVSFAACGWDHLISMIFLMMTRSPVMLLYT